MNSINLIFQPTQLVLLLPLQKHTLFYQPTTFHNSCLFSSYSVTKRRRFDIVSQVYYPFNVQGFIASGSTLAPVKHPDASVFILISVVLMIAFLITNFVVPHIIVKSLRLGEANEEDKDDNNLN
ncbi:hypothetical protein KSS87_000239 [Heliosperma pusillum]|nr:hypothetical protein KSS87_000239 [Heliosperma pusillum]